jgi:protein-S-isoprenylcysteine O-methyltransferase Ste14
MLKVRKTRVEANRLIMASSIVVMTAYFVFFALTHSLLADTRTKRAIRRALGPASDRWYRLVYVILAAVAVLPFFYILAFMSDQTLYAVPAPYSWIMVAGQALAALAAIAALRQTGSLYFFGLSQLFSALSAEPGILVTSGFYCRIRNPLFFFGTVFLWLFPIMTVNLLTFNILATVYFIVGALHEEGALLEEFGDAYREYRQKVPMFIPRTRCRP